MYGLNFLTHIRAMSEGLKKVGAHAKVNFATLDLEVSHEGRYYEFAPRFASMGPGGHSLVYHSELTADVWQFAGWQIGGNRQCELRNNKLAFKRFCEKHAVRTPALRGGHDDSSLEVLIKEISAKEFRGAISGPMPLAKALAKSSGADTYLEEFIDGDPMQAWYWEGRLACVEIYKKALVVGDGRSTFRDLVACACPNSAAVNWETAERLAQYQGLDMQTVVPAGREVFADFRMHTPLQPMSTFSQNALEKITGSELHKQLVHAGQALLGAFPEPRQNIVFRLDGVVDRQGNVWFTDMGQDHYVHPDVYPLMAETLFGNPVHAAVLASIRAETSTQH